MFLNKLFHFVKGYVIIRISGNNIERFLFICAKRHIDFFRLGEKKDDVLRAYISISDFFRIKPVAQKASVNVRIEKKCGLPFYINRIKNRYVLLVSIFVFAAILFVSSQFIWTVELEGVNGTVPEMLSEAVEDTGIHIGAFRPMLASGEEMKNNILARCDGITWAWVYIKGTRAEVKCKIGKPAPRVYDRSVPCDIVAACDGIIQSVTEKNGNALVKKGDAVLKDDILIEGKRFLTDEAVCQRVHALGEVRADTVHERTTEIPLTLDKFEKTGRKRSCYTLKLFSKCFDLYNGKNIDFDLYETEEKLYEISYGKNNFSGIGLYRKIIYETEKKQVVLSVDDAVQMASDKLEEEISKELTIGAVLLNKNTISEKTNNASVKVTVSMEFNENIGVQRQK